MTETATQPMPAKVAPRRNETVPPPRIVVYGTRGIGKTTFGAHAPRPIFIRTEDGLSGLDVDTFPLCTSLEEVEMQLRWLAQEKHDYKTCVLDSLTGLEPLLWRRVIETRRDKKGRQVGSIADFEFQVGYDFAADVFSQDFLPMVNALRDRRMAVVLIAHVTQHKFDPPDMDAYERIGPAMHKKCNERLVNWADAVLYARARMAVTTERGRTKGKPVGDGSRELLTTDQPAWFAKNRYQLPEALDMGTADEPRGWHEFSSGFAAYVARKAEQRKQKDTAAAAAGSTTNNVSNADNNNSSNS